MKRFYSPGIIDARNRLVMPSLPVHDDAHDVFMALPHHTNTRKHDVQLDGTCRMCYLAHIVI